MIKLIRGVVRRLKRSSKHSSPIDPATIGISPDQVIGVWEFYMHLKIVVNSRSRNVRYYLSFGVKSRQIFFYDPETGKKRRVARKNSTLYTDVCALLDNWRHNKLMKRMLES